MPEIKTRKALKGTIKTLDKAAIIGDRMRVACVKGREQTAQAAEDTPEEYAADRMATAAELGSAEAVRAAQKDFFKPVPHRSAKKTVQDNSVSTAYRREKRNHAIRIVERSGETIRQSGKSTVKTAQRSIKTAKRSVRTAQTTAKTAQKTAQVAAKATHRAAQAARAAAKATVTGVKTAVKASVSAVKAIIAATKTLVAAIAAGGWVAVVVIIIICLIGLLVGSGFGIFFSGEDTGTGQTMRTAVREINDDYERRLEEIKDSVEYDALEMSGSRADWPEVLSVYAVKTAMDSDATMDVATVDDSRKALLLEIFWQMHEISSHTETFSETIIEEIDDGNGNIEETTTVVTRTTLYITVSHRTAEEMAELFSFTKSQQTQLAELLAEENDSLWAMVLYGVGGSDDAIVSVALSQVGNIGGQPYWSWYGFNVRVEWCACFVSWCANECGYIDSAVIPKFAGCGGGVQWFKNRDQWANRSIEPTAGMIIFFDWDGDGSANHVGIVEKCENGVVYTIEGNSGDACKRKQYTVGSNLILGYGVPTY